MTGSAVFKRQVFKPGRHIRDIRRGVTFRARDFLVRCLQIETRLAVIEARRLFPVALVVAALALGRELSLMRIRVAIHALPGEAEIRAGFIFY